MSYPHTHTHTHTQPGGRVALKHYEPSYDFPGYPGVCGLARLSQSEKALFVCALSSRRGPLIPMTPSPAENYHTSRYQDAPMQPQTWEHAKPKIVWRMEVFCMCVCWGAEASTEGVGKDMGSFRWARAVLNTNGLIVCTPQMLMVHTQMWLFSSMEGLKFLAKNWQAGDVFSGLRRQPNRGKCNTELTYRRSIYSSLCALNKSVMWCLSYRLAPQIYTKNLRIPSKL